MIQSLKKLHGFTLIEVIVTITLFVLFISLVIGIMNLVLSGQQASGARIGCENRMRTLEIMFKQDLASALGCTFVDEDSLQVIGAVDSNGKPVDNLIYRFDSEKRQVIRQADQKIKKIEFIEMTKGIKNFEFSSSFYDQTGKNAVSPEKASFVEVSLQFGDYEAEKRTISFRATKKSTFSEDSVEDSLTWEE
ncbi:MAG: PulJ/GspJ family protein [Candidatus Rifleibacteriota bacterium]